MIPKKETKTAIGFGLMGLTLVAVCYLGLCRAIGLDLMAHSPYDSYSLQAMLWRDGQCWLDENRPWLELAIYNGRYYISFPPFPTVVMLPLTFFFGENTPSQMVSFLCVLMSYGLGYLLARRHKVAPWLSACMAAFLVLGCNLCEYGLYGGVWNVAQSLAFLLTLAAFFCVESRKKAAIYAGLIFIACAVGCRPFQAVYVPLLMYMAWKRLGWKGLMKAIVAPGLIAVAYGAYNFIRFDNPLQFGHDYLPEHAIESLHGQFSLHYVWGNLQNILRMPWWEEGYLTFPTAYGFAFWLANPLFVLFAGRFIVQTARGKTRLQGWALLICLLVHFSLLLMHKTFGGVQFGTRYLCDLIPALYFYWSRPARSRWSRVLMVAVMVWGVAFNVYGTWYYHVMLRL